MTKRIVFDVESNGLHGIGFAVGAVVIDESGSEVASFYAGCDPTTLPIRYDDREWMQANCYPALPPPTHEMPREVRDAFWVFWQEHRADSTLWADCAWPVEARFLLACVEDDPSRWWDGPYPLHEIAEHIGMSTHARLPNELPAHNPLNDARQSARLLVSPSP